MIVLRNRNNLAYDNRIQRITIIVMLMISLLILVRDIAGVSMSRYVFIGLAFILFALTKKKDIFCFMAFITPLCSGISYTYITIVALLFLIVKHQKLNLNYLGGCCIFSILLVELLSAFMGEFSLPEYVRFAGVLCLAYGRMIDKGDDYDDEGMIRCFLAGLIVAMMSIWGQMLGTYSFSTILTLGDRALRFGNTREALDITEEGMRIFFNPNGLGNLCIIALLFCLILGYQKRKIIYYVLFLLFSFQGLMTQSRAFIIVYVLVVVAFFILVSKNLKSVIRGSLIAGFITIAAYFIGNKFFASYIDAIYLRFHVIDITNGRTSLLGEYFNKWLQSTWRVFFGSGLQNYPEKYGMQLASHNSVQEILITWGIIGFIFVVLLIGVVLITAKLKRPSMMMIQMIPFLAYLVLTMSGQGFSDTSGLLRLMVSYSAMMLVLDNKMKGRSWMDVHGDAKQDV